MTLMTDLMALDTESGRLVKKSKGDEGVTGPGASAPGGSGAATPPGKQPRRKPRSSSSTGIFFVILCFLWLSSKKLSKQSRIFRFTTYVRTDYAKVTRLAT